MLKTIAVGLLAAGLSATAALAAPEFRRAGAVVNDEGDLVVAFSEIGLPKGTDINISIKATARASYGCLNGGGHIVGDVETTRQRLTNAQTLNTGLRRRISGGTVFNAPETDVTCPGGHEVVLVCVLWTRARIDDTTTPTFVRLGSFSRNFYPEEVPVCPPAPDAD
jgi:hypothetical protein